MRIPQYDIFVGTFGEDAIWLEAVDGLGSATERMKELAGKHPGKYFVFCLRTHMVLASIDTSAVKENENRKIV